MKLEVADELKLIYEACFKVGLPKSIQKPVNKGVAKAGTALFFCENLFNY
ncbi:hypothetical protein [Archaeoglobus neptunius]|nr:hypothetical protein [Archaeoglobus neptunius]